MSVYTKQQWADGQIGNPYGPISAARLNFMETGIAAAVVAPPSSYTLEVVGSTVLAHGNGGLADFSGSDGGAVLQSVITALGATGGRVFLRAGTYPWSTVPAIPPGITGKLHIQGEAGATVQLSTGGPRFLDFNRTADYQTFQNIEVSDVTVDCNNVIGTSHNHTLIGSQPGGGVLSRVNFDRIAVRRCRTINVPLSDTQSRSSVMLSSSHAASGETQTTITNVVVEDCDFQGGNVGVAIYGTGTYTAGLGVNVYVDNVFVTRVRHDQGVVPTGTNTIGANFQVGGVGHGGTVRFRDCIGVNSTDVGYEIDGIQDFRADGCVGVDSWNAKFFSRNFRLPVNVNAQRNVWAGCYGHNLNLDRATRVSSDFAVGGDAATAGYVFGEFAIIDGNCSDEKTTMPNTSGMNFSSNAGSGGVQFRQLTVRNLLCSYTALNATAGGNNPIFVDCRSVIGDALFDVDGLRFYIAGTRSGAGLNTWKMTRFAGLTPTLWLRNFMIDGPGLTNATTGTDSFRWIAFSDFTHTLRIFIQGVHAVTTPPGAHQVVDVSNTSLTVSRALVEGLNTSKLTSGNGFDISFGANTAAQTQIVATKILSQRTAASGSGPITAPTALSGLTTTVGTAIGTAVPSIPCIAQFVQGSGSGITAIDFSTNGGTTYTNLLTQASGPMPVGADLIVGPLMPTALIKATFTTTQPTVNLIPTAL